MATASRSSPHVGSSSSKPPVTASGLTLEQLRSAAVLVGELSSLSLGGEPLGELFERLCRLCAELTGASATIFSPRGDEYHQVARSRFPPRLASVHPGVFLLNEARQLAGEVGADGVAHTRTLHSKPKGPSPISLCALPFGERALPGPSVLVLARESPIEDDLVEAVQGLLDDAEALVTWAGRNERLNLGLAAASATKRLLGEGAGSTSALQAATVTAEVVRDVLGTDRTLVFCYPEEEGDSLQVANVGMSAEQDELVRKILTEGRYMASEGWQRAMASTEPLFVEDPGDDPRRPGGIMDALGINSYVSLPLHSAVGRVGHIISGNVGRNRRWRSWERALVAQIVAEASLVLDRARLREAEHAHKRLLAHQASHDPLTGLANRRAFDEALAAALAGATFSRPVALMILDLDRFKSVNDALGHHWGDKLLVEVARRLSRAVRPPHLSARLGGDEFAVVLSDTDAGAAEVLARHLGQAIASIEEVDGRKVTARASIGIAVAPEQGTDSDRLIQCADAAKRRVSSAH